MWNMKGTETLDLVCFMSTVRSGVSIQRESAGMSDWLGNSKYERAAADSLFMQGETEHAQGRTHWQKFAWVNPRGMWAAWARQNGM
jgi:hypothetical protein